MATTNPEDPFLYGVGIGVGTALYPSGVSLEGKKYRDRYRDVVGFIQPTLRHSSFVTGVWRTEVVAPPRTDGRHIWQEHAKYLTSILVRASATHTPGGSPQAPWGKPLDTTKRHKARMLGPMRGVRVVCHLDTEQFKYEYCWWFGGNDFRAAPESDWALGDNPSGFRVNQESEWMPKGPKPPTRADAALWLASIVQVIGEFPRQYTPPI